MGGSGGSGGEGSIEDYKREIRESREKTQDAEFDTEVNRKIDERLAQYNARDSETTRDHLGDIKKHIEEDIGGTIGLKFGGSLSKHTYVDGLSDTDVLVLIDKTELADKSPHEVLDYIKNKLLEKKMKDVESIRTGQLAVTVRYKDGTEIQLVPAVRKGEGYHIPAETGNRWSNVIRPDRFAQRLTDVNQSCGGKVVPVIKLVKGINSQLPKNQQLTGYHIESIAIEVFKSYPDSKRTPKEMVKYFFEKARDIVKSPIKDKTGQSINVDDYIGGENSRKRLRSSYALDRVYRRMETADEIKSVDDWDSVLGDVE